VCVCSISDPLGSFDTIESVERELACMTYRSSSSESGTVYAVECFDCISEDDVVEAT